MGKLYGVMARYSGIGLVLLVLALIPQQARAVPDTFDWYRGAEGFAEAKELSDKGERPLFIFFYVDWCSWCKALKKDYLDEREIYNFLGDFLRVEINPEKGKEERKLGTQYGINSYPSFFITFPGVSERKRPYPFRNGGNLSPEEFIAEMKNDLASLCISKGFNVWPTKDWEKSVRFFTMALEFNPEASRADYGLGVSYRELGEARNDLALLNMAEKSLHKAYDNQPDLTDAIGELEKVRWAIDKISRSGTKSAVTSAETPPAERAKGTAPPMKQSLSATVADPAPKREDPPRNEVKEIVASLVKIIRETSPKVSMTVRGGWPTFSCSDYLCAIISDEESVDLNFFNGAVLHDPQGRLKTRAGKIGTLTFTRVSEIEPKNIQLLVEQAMAYEGRKATP